MPAQCHRGIKLLVDHLQRPGDARLAHRSESLGRYEVVLLYGHYDKQPEFSGWDEDLDPWTPVIKDGKLYGRGGADDGYATFGSLTAIRALQEQGIPHAHCVVIVEGCEESGSFDLPYYIDMLEDRIGSPDLVVCLDAECGNYDQLWCTTTLRGNLALLGRQPPLPDNERKDILSDMVGENERLIRLVREQSEHYDFIFLDCPPNLGALTAAALPPLSMVKVSVVTSPAVIVPGANALVNPGTAFDNDFVIFIFRRSVGDKFKPDDLTAISFFKGNTGEANNIPRRHNSKY